MKNKILSFSIAVLILYCLVIPATKAAQSDSVLVKVRVLPSISVSISEDAVSLGSVNAGATVISSEPVKITNDGSGIEETYSISLSNPDGWTASQTAAGADTYVLNAAFSSASSNIIWSEADHALSTTPVASSTTKFAGDQTGINVPQGALRILWFQFKAPTATLVNTEQDIVITITAQAS